jgi:hypothetical protein
MPARVQGFDLVGERLQQALADNGLLQNRCEGGHGRCDRALSGEAQPSVEAAR